MRGFFRALLTGASLTVGAAAWAEEPPVPRMLPCFEIEDVQPDHTALELAGAVRSCVEAGRHGDGMAIFIAFNSYSLFDQQRVRDETAHEILTELNQWIFNGMGKDDIDVLRRHAETLRLGDSAYQDRICNALWAVGPPSYRPSYMIAFGQMPRKGDDDWQVDGFDAEVAWKVAVGEKNRCGDARL
ncbi:hypothetical protein [Shimia biformata]|uniref:hypothetical protein n=1 Tax=Shimia biformata TaxID=1294299 RepID=UPI001950DF1D|nr:hypothetical protein [Shimia biformata]